MSNGNVLITGGCGYIGSMLVGYLLERNFKVKCIDSLIYDNFYSIAPFIGHPNFSFEKKDVICLTKKDVSEYKSLVLLAAYVGMPICDKCPYEAKKTNYESIVRLIPLLEENQRIVYCNSNSAYGSSKDICTEESPVKALSLYAETKLNAEQELIKLHKNTVSLRLATVCGIGLKNRFDLLVNDLTQKYYFDGKLELFQPYVNRNYLHVRDAVRAIAYFVSHKQFFGIYNCGDPDGNFPKYQLAQRIGDIAGEKNNDFIKLVEGDDIDKRDYIISNRKILDAGFDFKFSIDRAIEEVLTFCEHTSREKIKLMRNV